MPSLAACYNIELSCAQAQFVEIGMRPSKRCRMGAKAHAMPHFLLAVRGSQRRSPRFGLVRRCVPRSPAAAAGVAGGEADAVISCFRIRTAFLAASPHLSWVRLGGGTLS